MSPYSAAQRWKTASGLESASGTFPIRKCGLGPGGRNAFSLHRRGARQCIEAAVPRDQVPKGDVLVECKLDRLSGSWREREIADSWCERGAGRYIAEQNGFHIDN